MYHNVNALCLYLFSFTAIERTNAHNYNYNWLNHPIQLLQRINIIFPTLFSLLSPCPSASQLSLLRIGKRKTLSKSRMLCPRIFLLLRNFFSPVKDCLLPSCLWYSWCGFRSIIVLTCSYYSLYNLQINEWLNVVIHVHRQVWSGLHVVNKSTWSKHYTCFRLD